MPNKLNYSIILETKDTICNQIAWGLDYIHNLRPQLMPKGFTLYERTLCVRLKSISQFNSDWLPGHLSTARTVTNLAPYLTGESWCSSNTALDIATSICGENKTRRHPSFQAASYRNTQSFALSAHCLVLKTKQTHIFRDQLKRACLRMYAMLCVSQISPGDA